MFRKLILFLVVLLAQSQLAHAAADKYQIDKDHTHIIFMVSHVGFSNTIGRIREFDGYFTFDEQEPQQSAIDVTLNSASIATDVPALDKELAGDKFLNVKKFPTMHFKSAHINVTGKNTADITGDFTLLGVTKHLTLNVTYNKSGIHPFTNNYVSGFSADATLKRSDYGMAAYIPAVGDEVKIHIEIEGIDPLKHPGNAKTSH
jgi:polyisoprenoid-binding protein YceI